MFAQTLNPETIRRIETTRHLERQQRRNDLLDRLLEAARREGPDSIYAEMYAELSTESI